MAARSPVRLAAPLALCAALIALVLVIQTSHPSSSSTATQPAAASQDTAQKAPRKKLRKVYVVRSGDVLAQIAEKNGVTVEQIIARNPSIDPQTLQVGQRIKLR